MRNEALALFTQQHEDLMTDLRQARDDLIFVAEHLARPERNVQELEKRMDRAARLQDDYWIRAQEMNEWVNAQTEAMQDCPQEIQREFLWRIHQVTITFHVVNAMGHALQDVTKRLNEMRGQDED